MMPFTTSEGLEALLGEIDPLAIERILDTHATIDEVAEALAGLEDERVQGERHEPSSARVVQVRAILEDVLEDEDGDDDRGRMVGQAT